MGSVLLLALLDKQEMRLREFKCLSQNYTIIKRENWETKY